MQNEIYSQVAFIALWTDKNDLMLNVPLYVKIDEIKTKSGLPQCIEDIMHHISAVMIRRYEKQLSVYFEKLKKEQQNETNNF